MSCSCDQRPIIDAQGLSVFKYHETFTPSTTTTAAGKTILAGPIQMQKVFEACNGSGWLRSLSVKEFGTSQLCDLDIIFCGNPGHTITVDTTIDFTATDADTIALFDTITIPTAKYLNKTAYYEAIADIPKDFTFWNISTDNGLSRDLWFYVVARAVKTFTSSTRLVLKMDIVSD